MRLIPPVSGQNTAPYTCVPYTSDKWSRSGSPGVTALPGLRHQPGGSPHPFVLQASPAKSPFASAVPRCLYKFTVCWWCNNCVKLDKNLSQGREASLFPWGKISASLTQSHWMGPQPLGLFCSCRRRWGPKSFMESALLHDHFWRLLMYSSPLF